MGNFYTKEQYLEHMINIIENNEIDCLFEQLMNSIIPENIEYYRKELHNKLKQLNFHDYFDEKLIYQNSESWTVMVLFLAILKNNHKVIRYLASTSKHDILVSVYKTSLPKIHEIIDDEMFSLLTSGKLCVSKYASMIVFSFHCKKSKDFINEQMIIENNKRGIDSVDALRINEDMIETLYKFNDEFAKHIVKTKIIYTPILDEEAANLYRFIENDRKYVKSLLYEIIRVNRFNLLKILIDRGFRLFVDEELDVDFKNIDLEFIELLSSLENFDDFIQVNRHSLMKTSTNEVRDYLLTRF